MGCSMFNAMIHSLMKFSHWMHESGARVMEYLSGTMMLVFSLNILFAPEWVLSQQSYAEIFGQGLGWYVGTALIGIVQVLIAPLTTVRANRISAFLLMTSGVIWAILAMKFYIPFGMNTAVGTYGVLSFFSMFAGQFLMSSCDKIVQEFSRHGA